MAIIMKDCHFENNGTGIKAPTSADIQMSGTTFVRNGKALDIYVSAVDLQKLGLPPDTPQELMQEIIATLQGISAEPAKVKQEAIENSRLFKWLGHAASLATVGTALVQFVTAIG